MRTAAVRCSPAGSPCDSTDHPTAPPARCDRKKHLDLQYPGPPPVVSRIRTLRSNRTDRASVIDGGLAPGLLRLAKGLRRTRGGVRERGERCLEGRTAKWRATTGAYTPATARERSPAADRTSGSWFGPPGHRVHRNGHEKQRGQRMPAPSVPPGSRGGLIRYFLGGHADRTGQARVRLVTVGDGERRRRQAA